MDPPFREALLGEVWGVSLREPGKGKGSGSFPATKEKSMGQELESQFLVGGPSGPPPAQHK
jgi:hypothetical protein